jgi:hypothetical protein
MCHSDKPRWMGRAVCVVAPVVWLSGTGLSYLWNHENTPSDSPRAQTGRLKAPFTSLKITTLIIGASPMSCTRRIGELAACGSLSGALTLCPVHKTRVLRRTGRRLTFGERSQIPNQVSIEWRGSPSLIRHFRPNDALRSERGIGL